MEFQSAVVCVWFYNEYCFSMVLILVINVVLKLYDKECLEVDSVQKQYDGKIIVSDVYLKCETADIIGI
jgi:hypothetical protein